MKFRAFYYIIYSVKAKFFFVIFLFSFACLFSDELKENIQKEKTVLTEAEKIVRSRKINKNSEDPPEIIPIDFVSQKLNEEKATEVVKELGAKWLLKEVVDTDKLEDSIAVGEVDGSKFADCIDRKETLAVKFVKGKKDA